MAWRLLGNGCDKRFYIEESGNGGYGAILCSDAVAARETKAYIDLKTIDVTLLPTILPWTERAGILTEKGIEKPQYQMQRLYLDKTFKPQMCAMGVPPRTANLLKGGNKILIKAGLEEIASKIEPICRIVGELTLAVDKTSGRLYMLDFSPAENGNRAFCQLETIIKGLNNLMNSLD